MVRRQDERLGRQALAEETKMMHMCRCALERHLVLDSDRCDTYRKANLVIMQYVEQMQRNSDPKEVCEMWCTTANWKRSARSETPRENGAVTNKGIGRGRWKGAGWKQWSHEDSEHFPYNCHSCGEKGPRQRSAPRRWRKGLWRKGPKGVYWVDDEDGEAAGVGIAQDHGDIELCAIEEVGAGEIGGYTSDDLPPGLAHLDDRPHVGVRALGRADSAVHRICECMATQITRQPAPPLPESDPARNTWRNTLANMFEVGASVRRFRSIGARGPQSGGLQTVA